MKVLHVIDTLGVGGAEQVLVTLLPELAAQGIDVEVAVLRPPLTLAPDLEQRGITVHRLPAHDRWRLLKGMRSIAALVDTLGIDIVHAHLLFPSIYAGLMRMARLCEARTCVTWHNLAYAPGCNKPGPGLAVRRSLNGVTSRRGMDATIAVSTAVARHYAESLGVPEPVVIGNAVSVRDIDAAVATLPPPSPDGKALRIVLPGRMVREKGHAVMIEALSRLASRGLVFDAVFAGDGPLRRDIESAVAAAGLKERVTCTGVLVHEDMLATMAGADIVAVPSLFEGFGLTAAEAMALRRAVVVSSSGGLTDIVEDGVSGVVVTPGDVSQLAGALWHLAGDEAARVRLGEAARERVLDRFDAPRVASATLSVYRRIMGMN